MKSEKKIFLAFLINLIFSGIEFIGGTLTGSVAILSDSVHDFGDSISIGISYILEKISRKKPDDNYSFGYLRYSVLGSVFTTVILLFGSLAVIYNAVLRLINPVTINYDGMIILAVAGAVMNFVASYFTSGGDSLNQKAINLHCLEDVLGWVVVLVGALIMKFTDITCIDPIMSIAVAIFIFVNALKNLKSVLDLFLQKTPSTVDVEELKKHILSIEGVSALHHLHIWSIDGNSNLATVHIVTDEDTEKIKHKVKEEFLEHGVSHTTVETEKSSENCGEECCNPVISEHSHHHHHH